MKATLQAIALWAALCLPVAKVHAQTCPYLLRLLDSGGDGWDGSYVTVHVTETGQPTVSTNHTLSSGASEDILFEAPSAFVVLTFTAAGEGTDEIGVQLYSLDWDEPVGLFDGIPPLTPGLLHGHINQTNCGISFPPTDCFQAMHLGEYLLQWDPVVQFPTGVYQDLNTTNSGCLTTEHRPVWFSLSTGGKLGKGGGRLTLEIVTYPELDPEAEVDFALWSYAGAGSDCPGGMPIRCSAALGSGSTGMMEGPTDTSEDESGDGWVQDLIAGEDESFILLVDYISGTGAPFTIHVRTTPVITGEAEWETDAKHTLLLFPNPARDHVTINYTGTAPRSGALLIFDATGRQVASHPIPPHTGHWTIDVGSLGPGVYAVVSWTDEQQERAGLIIH